MKKENFSKRLENLRKRLGKNDLAFAKFCDIPTSTMHGYLTGKNFPSKDNLEKIIQACEVDRKWLETGRFKNGDDFTNEELEELWSFDPEIIDIERNGESLFPVVRAYDNSKELLFWCIHCGCWHVHGRDDYPFPVIGRSDPAGHRNAHCTTKNSPFQRTGYILDMLGSFDKEAPDKHHSEKEASLCPECREYYSLAFQSCVCGYSNSMTRSKFPKLAQCYRNLGLPPEKKNLKNEDEAQDGMLMALKLISAHERIEELMRENKKLSIENQKFNSENQRLRLELERVQKGKQPAAVREKTTTVAGKKRASAP